MVVDKVGIKESVIEAVMEMGVSLLQWDIGQLQVRYKEDKSPYSIADLTANSIGVKRLGQITPDIPIISEEAPLPAFSERKDWERFWLLDPLDGTRDYLKGSKNYCVSLGLVEHGRPTMGVLFAPQKEEIYWAISGKGSFKRSPQEHDRKLTGPRALGHKEAKTVTHSARKPSARLQSELKKLGLTKSLPLSSALKFGAFAEGIADYYVRTTPSMEWDVAAGECLAREVVENGADFKMFDYNTPHLKASRFVLSRAHFEKI